VIGKRVGSATEEQGGCPRGLQGAGPLEGARALDGPRRLSSAGVVGAVEVAS
jgi:hypothetical protein